MIEILVSLFLLTTSMLGFLSQEILSLRYSQDSQFKIQTAILIADLADRLKINKTVSLNTSAYQLGLNDTFNNDTNCESSGCTGNQLAHYDLSQWQKMVKNALPGAKAKIEPQLINGNSRSYKVTFSYQQLMAANEENVSTLSYHLRVY